MSANDFRFKKSDYASLEEVVRELGEERVVKLVNKVRRSSVRSAERSKEGRELMREKYGRHERF